MVLEAVTVEPCLIVPLIETDPLGTSLTLTTIELSELLTDSLVPRPSM